MQIFSADSKKRIFTLGDHKIDCRIGRTGSCHAQEKREGDGASPQGIWPIRGALFRPGYAKPPRHFALPWRWIRPNDGWCDDSKDPQYNRPVHRPYRASNEALLRTHDNAYNIILPLGYNDEPPILGKGSAIFLHLYSPRDFTQGCIALSPNNMQTLLNMIKTGDKIRIT